ncbi:RNA-directed DNA polymerase [Tanacetum coccineum]
MKVNVHGFEIIKELYKDDKFLSKIINQCSNNPYKEFIFHDGFLFCGNQLCIPDCSIRLEIIKEAHEGGLSGHFERDKTANLLKDYFFSPRMMKDVNQYILRCRTCYLANQTTGKSPFEIVYGCKPSSPLDLVPLPITSSYSSDADVQAEKIKELHEQVKGKIEKQNQKYAKQANKHRKLLTFKVGDLVWIHMSKECFPPSQNAKLKQRGDGPFRIV